MEISVLDRLPVTAAEVSSDTERFCMTFEEDEVVQFGITVRMLNAIGARYRIEGMDIIALTDHEPIK